MDDNGLLIKIAKYIKSDDFKNLEVKPVEYRAFKKGSSIQQHREEDPLSEINKKKTKDKEDLIIADNIIMYFFDLPDEKFLLCMQKIDKWGFDIFFKEFLINYYLIWTKDNRLKYYVMQNIDKFNNLVKNRLNETTINAMKNFNFDTTMVDHQIAIIKNDIKGKETVLMSLQPKAFDNTAPPADEKEEELEPGNKREFRLAVFARLKQENPGLLD